MARIIEAFSEFFTEKRLNKWIKVVSRILLVLLGLFIFFYGYFKWEEKESSIVSQGVKQLEDFVRKNPTDLRGRYELGRGYFALKRYDDAIEQFKEALKIDVEHQGSLVMLGICYIRKGQFNEAKRHLKQEIRLYSGAGLAGENRWLEEAYFQMAYIFWKEKNHDRALEYMQKALAIGRSDADNYFFMGRLYWEKGELQNAKLFFQRAIDFDPKYVDAHYGLARVLEKEGNLGLAVGEYHKANKYYQEKSLKVNKKIEDFKEAKEKEDKLFKKIKELAEKEPNKDNNFQLGLGYLGIEQYDKAISVLKKVAEKDPEFAPAYYYIGNAYEKKGYLKEAKSFYQKAISRDKNYDLAKGALKRLELGITEEEYIRRVW